MKTVFDPQQSRISVSKMLSLLELCGNNNLYGKYEYTLIV